MLRASIARSAYRSVLVVSVFDDAHGLMQAMKLVLQTPPSASESSRVSFESRYGMCFSLQARALMTRPGDGMGQTSQIARH